MNTPHFYRRSRPTLGGRQRRPRLEVEPLESRLVPYGLTGGEWIHPELITISFVPDGTILDYPNGSPVTSNLQSVLNARFGSSSVWQSEILRAAQTWARYTNLNFTVVSDNGAEFDTGAYQQGDGNMGDIRIGGYDMGLVGVSPIAFACPPLDGANSSGTGDVDFNTNVTCAWSIGGLDLYGIALHEIGHALGMDHSSHLAAAMFPTATASALTTDDKNGIRAIYGARNQDQYDAAADNGSISTPTNINSLLDSGAKTALVTGGDINNPDDGDFYKITAPSGGTGTMHVVVKSAGLSLLKPRLKVYTSGGTLLATANGAQFGDTISLDVSVNAGSNYKIKVDGYDDSVFGTGAYAMTFNFGTGADPSVPVPNTQELNDGSSSGFEALMLAPKSAPTSGGTVANVHGWRNDQGHISSTDSANPAVPQQARRGASAFRLHSAHAQQGAHSDLDAVFAEWDIAADDN